MKRLHGGTRTRRGPGPSLVRDCSRSRVKLAVRVEGPNKLLSMTAFGAQRKHGTLPTDFRSPPENGPSRCGHLTARFARGCGKTRHTRLTTGMRFSVLTAEA